MGYPVRMLQFGDGVFLRGFMDWMVERMNRSGRFLGSIAVVKPRPGDFNPAYGRQANEYTVSLKGILDGKRVETRERVASIGRLVNPWEDFDAYLREAANPDLDVIVSNTTESGIVPSPADKATDRPAPSFPGKLTQFLRARYEAFAGEPSRGLAIIPCELIEDNAGKLRELVLDHAGRWYSDPAFSAWLRDSNTWIDSLVDRIVTGFTEAEKAAILAAEGFEDDLVTVAEPYHILALRGPASMEKVLPLRSSGLNVVWADDITPYRELKVRLLNGSHTLLALCGLALGRKTVLECVGDPLLISAVRAYQLLETIPSMAGGRSPSPIATTEAESYLAGVLERFSNPDLAHKLTGIATKSVAKYAARILPTVRAHVKAAGQAPVMASFILAALADFYCAGSAQDESAPLGWFAEHKEAFVLDPAAAMREATGGSGPWGGMEGVGDLAAKAAEHLRRIRGAGMEAALREAVEPSRVAGAAT